MTSVSSEVPLDAATRAELQRRTLRALASGQVVGAAALASAVTVGAFVIQDILGQETPWAGSATAMVTMGTALMAQVLSRRMQRGGRRPGLVLGYSLAALGGVVAAAGAELHSLPLFLVGLFVFGNGQAANLLARYVPTDLAEPAERSRAMSRIVFASTFGAVLGPLMIGPTEHAAESWFGLDRYAGPWLFSAVFFVAAALNTAIRLRPDPLVAAGGVAAVGTGRAPLEFGTTVRVISGHSAARLAVTAMVISQVTMVAVMAMTPVHLKLHGHEGAQPVRRVAAHRRHVRVQSARRSLQRPAGPDPRHLGRGRACSSPRRRCRRCPATSSCCCSRRCGCSGSAGTSG